MALAACFLSSCGASASSPSNLGLSTANVRIGPDRGCSTALKTFQVEVADTDEERMQGLSGRHQPLASTSGMLFEFQGPSADSFYMRDTFIPLSIAFFDADHRLLKIFEMPVESDPAHPKTLYDPGTPYVDAVEAAPGSFAGMKPGSVYLCIG